MTSYPEPASLALTLEQLEDTGSETLRLESTDAPAIEVSYFSNDCWCLELRIDQFDPSIRRQPFTGVQNSLEKVSVTYRADDQSHEFRSLDSLLVFDKGNSSLSLSFSCGAKLATAPYPFKRHNKFVELPEGIESLKVTDFSFRTPVPFAPPVSFKTYMTRFQYNIPSSGPILGLPGQTGEINRRGYRYDLVNADQPLHIPSRPAMYQSWPILIHRDDTLSKWVAVFYDNPSRTFVDVGCFYSDKITFEAVTGNIRVYLLAGETLAEVSNRLSKLLGPSLFPPVWSFGYQQCRWSYMNSAEIRTVKQTFDSNKIPLDAIYFDIDYMEKFKVFSKNEEAFGDLAECVQEFANDDVKSICIVDPGVKIEEGFEAYERVKESGAYLKTSDGTPFEALVWPGKVLLPDFLDPRAEEAWCQLQNDWLHKYGFAGVWNDMNEPANFDGPFCATNSAFTERGDFRAESNLYGLGMAKVSNKSCAETVKGRPFVISRSGYPGVQQHAVIWHGDNHGWWEHLRMMIDTCVSYSLAGAYYTGADVPGFFESAPDDLAVRFFQAGSFLPMFRGHSWYFSKDKEPYAFSDWASSLIVDAIRGRYSLLREWYSGFEYCTRKMLPPLKPCFADNTLVRDQYLLFDKFVVAPVIERDQSKRLLYLPEGDWYALGDTSNLINGDSWLTVDVDMKSLPVYVKSGTILSRNEPTLRSVSTLQQETFEVYPATNGAANLGYWYDDEIGGHSLEVDKDLKNITKNKLSRS